MHEVIRLRCCKHVPNDNNHIPLQQRLRSGKWHPSHGAPTVERSLFDHVHAILRALWAQLPRGRVGKFAGQELIPKTARDANEFAHKNAMALTNMIQLEGKSGKPEVKTVDRCLSLFLKQKCKTTGKVSNSFAWPNFTMTENEMEVAVDGALTHWQAEAP